MDDMFLPSKRTDNHNDSLKDDQIADSWDDQHHDNLANQVPIETINLADDSTAIPNQTPITDNRSDPNNIIDNKKSKHRLTKKSWLIIVAAIVLLVIIAGLSYWFLIKPRTSQTTTDNHPIVTTKTSSSVQQLIVSPLTGMTLSNPALAKRPVTGLMIENSLEARPQSGLIDAGVVFEAVAEGGITRFLALYQEAQPQYIGPIRSARPYFIDFALGFDASLGHVGGSPQALSDIKTLNVRDLDEFYNGSAYWRISSRQAPHNMYTSFAKLDALNQAKGYTSSTFTPFVRKKDVPQTPTASSINFAISGYNYDVQYQYNATTNSYNRSEGGSPQIDQQTNTQLSPKVVIALVMNQSLAADRDHTIYQDVGSGEMYVFQDGICSQGTWSKASRQSQFVFTDKDGLPMKLNAGQTWITIVGAASDVSYTP